MSCYLRCVKFINQNKSHSGGSYSIAARRTDYGDHLLQLCSDNRFSLASTNFKHKENIIWHGDLEIDSMMGPNRSHCISHQWKSSKKDSLILEPMFRLGSWFGSSTYLSASYWTRKNHSKKTTSSSAWWKVKNIYQEQLERQLVNYISDVHPEVVWHSTI